MRPSFPVFRETLFFLYNVVIIILRIFRKHCNIREKKKKKKKKKKKEERLGKNDKDGQIDVTTIND